MKSNKQTIQDYKNNRELSEISLLNKITIVPSFRDKDSYTYIGNTLQI